MKVKAKGQSLFLDFFLRTLHCMYKSLQLGAFFESIYYNSTNYFSKSVSFDCKLCHFSTGGVPDMYCYCHLLLIV
jgi:hypothetical protein